MSTTWKRRNQFDDVSEGERSPKRRHSRQSSEVEQRNSDPEDAYMPVPMPLPRYDPNLRLKNTAMSGDQNSIVRVPPHYYLHVLDQTSNVTRVELGPQTYIRKDNERLILGPEKMVIVPPRHYCVIQNPVVKDEDENVVLDKFGQVKLQHAEIEIRLEQDPFPLYPGEALSGKVLALQVVPQNCAFRLRAVRDFTQDEVKKVAGDEWLFEGPGTYIPRKEVEVKETLKAVIIKPNEALRLRARIATKDRDGNDRAAGEEWLVRRIGAYLPGAYEEVIKVVQAYILTKKVAIHIEATRTFKDYFEKERKAGEEWLVTLDDAESYIPGVYETVKGTVDLTTLTNRQFVVILNPVDKDGKPQMGKKKLVKGDKSFFLQPGESLENDHIFDVYVLGENEGLILKANEGFKDTDVEPAVERKPGDKWMIRGPREYIPPVQVTVEQQQDATPLDVNEGIYVRNIKTGEVRAIRGESYMLTQDEEMWEKELPPQVEVLLSGMKDPLADRGQRFSGGSMEERDKTSVVTFRVPHNTAVQVYDYKEKKARVVFGPDLVMLDPDEQFTQLTLSAGKPKKPNQIRAIGLLLGPDFCSDIITVETGDHARLSLQLSYNWHFDVGKRTDVDAARLFSVPDFVGDMCKAMASRIRGAVASVMFDDFHKNSARIIRSAVFGMDENNKVLDSSVFPQNNLVVTSVDIQSVEPVDQRTRDSLMKSVQLAIEITTKSQEATAKHEAERVEQVARGRLERQRIADEAEAEKARKNLLELQAASSAVESCGQAKAEAQSRAEAARIEGEAAVNQADLKAQAGKIAAEAELERLRKARDAELDYTSQQNKMEVEKKEKLAAIEVEKFSKMVEALGADTIKAMATAGADNQVKMLQSLGIQSALITDGRTPVNLMGTALGLLGSLTETPK